jgi:hypothetical protein
MTTETTYVSPYDRRIQLVVDALLEKPESASEAPMSEDTARRLATRVVYVLDHIPERVR